METLNKPGPYDGVHMGHVMHGPGDPKEASGKSNVKPAEIHLARDMNSNPESSSLRSEAKPTKMDMRLTWE